MRVVGRIERGTFAVGSKSERLGAVYLRTENKRRFVLRRSGGNPHHDPEIEALEGRRVRADGIAHGHTFLFDAIEVLDDAEP
ncbi:MAG: hypothetical protein IT503_16725 [Burkholderiaceae bacterium]|nr:MAG: hypothetical protein F9K36_05115 [Burkholderiaceae bacterium]MBE7427029.1 hypothetical protein [Ideonella sp.]MCC7287819.1 hypothetical protein [Burkholderiaceae bacterium]